MNFPTTPDGITAEWLTNLLQETGVLTDQRIQTITMRMLGEDKGNTGQLARLHLTYDTPTALAPDSLIAKCSTPNPQVRPMLHSMGFYEREVRFYEQIAPLSNLRTPRCYFSALDPDSGLSLLLLEDLSFAENGSAITGCSLEDAEIAVLALAPFHAQWWQQPFTGERSWLTLRGFLSTPKIQPSFDQTWEPFLSAISPSLTEQILPLSDDLHRHLGRISAYLYEDSPHTLIHNDYHLENLFYTGTGNSRSLAVADWQGTTLGHGVIDVARFLGGNLDPRHRRDHEMRILRTYHALLQENGVMDYSFEQCWNDYRLAMLLPVGLITMVVGMAARMTPDPASLKGGPREIIVSRYCQAIADLKVSELLAAALPVAAVQC